MKERTIKPTREKWTAAEDYLNRSYKRILIPDPEGGFTARILEFPGCFAEGETAEEAYANLESAAADWIKAALNQGQTIPEPDGGDGYSGKIVLRLPRALHARAAELAELNQTSLNQFLVSAIAARVGAEDIVERISKRWLGTINVVQQAHIHSYGNVGLSFSMTTGMGPGDFDLQAVASRALASAPEPKVA